MRINPMVTAAAVSIVVASALVGCSSSGNGGGGTSSSAGSSSTGTTSTSQSAAAATGTTIPLGYICSCSGALAASLGKAKDAIQIWEQTVNETGGVAGHQVKVYVEDDAGDPVKALAAVKTLVEQDHVIAIVGEDSTVDSSFSDYITSKKIPVVGGAYGNPPFDTNPNFFSTGPSQFVYSFAFAQQAQKAGKKKIGEVYCAEAPVCKASADQTMDAAKVLGIAATELKVSATAPSYTAQCLTMKNSGVDALVPALDPVTVSRVVDDCAQIGFKPMLLNAGGSVSSTLLKDKNMEGDVLIQGNAQFTDPQFPGNKEMLDAFKAKEPSLLTSGQFTYWLQIAWTGGKLFEAAAKAGGFSADKTVTSADVFAGMYAIKGDTLGGVTAPLSYTEGKAAPPQCYFLQKVQGGAIVSDGTTPTCLTDDQVSQMKAAVGG